MRISVLAANPLDGDGREARTARALGAAGHEVVVVARAGGAGSAGRGVAVRACRPRPYGWPLRPFAAAIAWPATAWALWRSRPEVVHAAGPRALVRAWLVARLRGARLVYDAAPGRAGSRIGRRERLLAPRCRAVVAGSRAGAADLQAGLRLAMRPVVVRDAPDVAGPKALAGARLRERLGIDPTRLVIQDARGEERGYESLLQAIGGLSGTHVVAFAEERAADRLRLAAERNRVAGRVHVIRPPEPRRLAAFAHDADAAVCLPDGDARNGAPAPAARLLAYLAGGRSVLTSLPAAELAGLEGAIAVDPADAGALAAALDSVAGEPVPAGPTWEAEAGTLVALYGGLDGLTPARGAAAERRPGRLQRAAAAARAEAGVLTDRRGRRHPRAGALYARARWLRDAGRPAEAERALARAVRLDAEDDRYRYHWAASLRDEGRRDEAVEQYRILVARAEGPAGPFLAGSATALARLGARREAEAVLVSLEREGPAAAAAVAELRSALGDVSGARAALAGIADDAGDRAVEHTRIRVLEQCGEPSAALEHARRAGEVAAGRRLEGTLRAHDAVWRPAPPAPRAWHGPASEDVVLHLLESSLPYATSGYTYRTSTVLAAQRAAGLRPVAVTRLGFPANRGVRAHQPLEVVDGVVHTFLTLPGVTRYTSIPVDELLERNAAMLGGLVEDTRPAVLHATSPHHNGLVGLSLRDAYGIGLVYEVRGFPEMTWAVRRGGRDAEAYALRREAETRCMLEADAVVTLSEVMRAHVVERGVPAERVHVVPHMVDTERFAPRPKDPALLRRHGLEDRVVVGYVSSLVDYEGVDVLLRAIAQARARAPRIAGLVVGDGPAMGALRRLAADLGLDDAVRFTARVPHAETVEHYAAIDVFVVPRRGLEVCSYVTPLKPFEAMAMERCVVVSDLPALAEAVGWGSHGCRFEPDDPESLAERLVELAGDGERRAELGRMARAFVQERHSRALPADVVAAPIRAAAAAAARS
jgi:glycosyltransferase involved in cell wall biosynthesis